MLLSIVIPSYNHEEFILSTIRAAARIDIQDKEILVIDDGSSDGSTRVIREYIAGEGAGTNIRLIARENRGLVRTLNEGLSIVQGKYLYLVASDDIPIPEGVAGLVQILEKNDALQFVLGNALYMESEEQSQFRPAYGEAHRRFFDLPFEKRHREMFLRYPQPILIQGTVFRTSALRAIGGWREDIVIDDFSTFLRMFSQHRDVGKDFAYRPEIMVAFYRRHPANSSRNLERQFTMVEEALSKLCPNEWRDAALCRNFGAHGFIALRTKKLSVAARFLQSTLRHVGLAGFLRAFGSELGSTLKARISGSRVSNVTPQVTYAPASAIIRGTKHASS